jgi:hypothetical protein
LIPLKRLSQGVLEGLASQNRLAGSGGGSGLNQFAIVGLATSGGFVAGITNAGWTTITSISFMVGRASGVLIWANVSWARTAGTIVDTFFGEIQIDNDPDWTTGLGLVDGGTMLATAPNDTFTRSGLLVKGYTSLGPGAHSAKLKVTVNGDTFQCQGTITVMGGF